MFSVIISFNLICSDIYAEYSDNPLDKRGSSTDKKQYSDNPLDGPTSPTKKNEDIDNAPSSSLSKPVMFTDQALGENETSEWIEYKNVKKRRVQ